MSADGDFLEFLTDDEAGEHDLDEDGDDGDDEDDDGGFVDDGEFAAEDAGPVINMSEDIKIVPSIDDSDIREIGAQAVWSVSSAKPGFGVQRLRDDDDTTFWQSDSAQPHTVEIQFNKMVSLAVVALLLDLGADESYTPLRVSVSGGTTSHDLDEFRRDELAHPQGWVLIPLTAAMADGETLFDEGRAAKAPRLSLLRVQVLANYENGRDSRVRGLRVYAPRQPTYVSLGVPRFATVPMTQWTSIR